MWAWFQNKSIRTKIYACFFAVFVVTLLLGGLSLQRLVALNEITEEINGDWLPSIRMLSDIGSNSERYRNLQSLTLLTKAPELKAGVAERMKKVAQKRKEIWDKHDATIPTGYEKEMSQGVSDKWEAYLKLSDEMLALDRSGKNDEAIAFMNTTLQMSMDQYRKSFQDFLDHHVRGSEGAAKRSAELYDEAMFEVLSFIGLALLLCLAAGGMIISSVSMPVHLLTQAMKRLARQDFAVDVPGLGREDEVGHMAQAVEVFKEGMIAADRLNAEKVQEQKAREERAIKIEALTGHFGQKVGTLIAGLQKAAAALRGTAESMTSAADQTNQRSVIVASAAEQASGSVQTVASAAEELASSINEISRQVASSSEMAKSATQEAQTTDAMVQNLAATAQKIGNIVEMINDIAGQTNLLALNATIEAARAGEAGKGFAVVAGEVKSLASQTGKATEEIATQIGQIQQATTNVVEAIHTIGSKIDGINQVGAVVSSSIRQQQEATNEIASTIQQTAQGTSEVSSNIIGVKEAAYHTGEAAQQVLSAADHLATEAQEIACEIEGFIAGIKSA